MEHQMRWIWHGVRESEPLLLSCEKNNIHPSTHIFFILTILVKKQRKRKNSSLQKDSSINLFMFELGLKIVGYKCSIFCKFRAEFNIDVVWVLLSPLALSLQHQVSGVSSDITMMYRIIMTVYNTAMTAMDNQQVHPSAIIVFNCL